MCKVAVIGYGVVGSGTVELFMKNRESISKKVGKECDIKYILDLRDFPDSPFADKMIKDFNIILNDAEVEVVAEVVGGTTFAYDYTTPSWPGERCYIKQCASCGKGCRAS